ncbi:MAG: hypothetical protein RJQ01_00190 [Microcella sp.]|uniref:hypothetical protein n=1 Tax=Microcella sp. TaxID=1913979 RepID=UPI003315DA92
MTARAAVEHRELARFPWGVSVHESQAGRASTERIDPLSAVAARPVTGGILVLAVALPLLTLLTRADEITVGAGLVGALGLVVISCLLILDRTRAHRPVFSVTLGLVVYLLQAGVLALAVASTYGANDLLRDDWAPIVVGLVLFSLAPYRPAVELAAATAGLTALSAGFAVLQAPFATTDVPLATFAVAGSSSLACLGFASAAYALSMNGSILAWLEQAWRSAAAAAVEQRGGVARSVQQQRVSLVNRKVVPYFTRISAAETLTAEDREEARELAVSIRALLVADIERGWAQALLDELCSRAPGAPIPGVADDPDDVGRSLTTAQRTLLRAIGMEAVERVGVSSVELRIRETATSVSVRWWLATPGGGARAARQLTATLHLVRGLTHRSRVDTQADAVTLEFEYGR